MPPYMHQSMQVFCIYAWLECFALLKLHVGTHVVSVFIDSLVGSLQADP